MEKFCDLRGQGGAPGDREAQPSAKARVDFRKYQFVGQRASRTKKPRDFPLLSLIAADPSTDGDRRAKDGPLEDAACCRSGADSAVGVFVNSRNGKEKRRANDQKILGDGFHRAGKAAGVPFGHDHKMFQPPERMGKGQKLENDVLIRCWNSRINGIDHKEIVRMSRKNPLGLPGCTGGIDDRKVVFRTQGTGQMLKCPIVALAVAPAHLL